MKNFYLDFFCCELAQVIILVKNSFFTAFKASKTIVVFFIKFYKRDIPRTLHIILHIQDYRPNIEDHCLRRVPPGLHMLEYSSYTLVGVQSLHNSADILNHSLQCFVRFHNHRLHSHMMGHIVVHIHRIPVRIRHSHYKKPTLKPCMLIELRPSHNQSESFRRVRIREFEI